MTSSQHLSAAVQPASESTLVVGVEFGAALDGLIDSGRLTESIESGLSEKLSALGISSSVSVTLTSRGDSQGPAERILKVHINGKVARYPDHLLQILHGYVTGSAPEPGKTPEGILAWLAKAAESDESAAIEFVTLACEEIVGLHPALLLTDGHVQGVLERIGVKSGGGAPVSAADVRRALESALEAGVSVEQADGVFISHGDSDACTVAEQLVAAGQSAEVEVRLPLEYLRVLSTAALSDWHAGFETLHSGMFTELGTPLPRFRFVVDDRLRPGTFRFKINQIATPPIVGLSPDECLINDTAERVAAIFVAARPALNPATGFPAAIAALDERAYLESKGLTVWDAREFLILSAAEAVRRRTHFFTDERLTEKLLLELRGTCPQIVDAVKSMFSTEQVTSILRALVAEQVSIRNFWKVCECLADTEGLPDEGARLASVRMGLRREISNKAARSMAVLVAYLLDDPILHLLRMQPASNLVEADCDRILGAIRAEMAHLPPTAVVPTLIATNDTRQALRRVVREEFPRLTVLSYGELAPEVVIQPVARITCER